MGRGGWHSHHRRIARSAWGLDLRSQTFGSHWQQYSGEQGNIVQFGPEEADNYIKNKGSGEKIYMKREGNSYVIEGDLCDASTFHGQVNM